jgi:hypothetical protein
MICEARLNTLASLTRHYQESWQLINLWIEQHVNLKYGIDKRKQIKEWKLTPVHAPAPQRYLSLLHSATQVK